MESLAAVLTLSATSGIFLLSDRARELLCCSLTSCDFTLSSRSVLHPPSVHVLLLLEPMLNSWHREQIIEVTAASFSPTSTWTFNHGLPCCHSGLNPTLWPLLWRFRGWSQVWSTIVDWSHVVSAPLDEGSSLVLVSDAGSSTPLENLKIYKRNFACFLPPYRKSLNHQPE